MKKIFKIGIPIILVLGVIGACTTAPFNDDEFYGSSDGVSEENKTTSTINKLKEFTTVTKENDRYIFKYHDNEINWELVYSKENDFVRIFDSKIQNMFVGYYDDSGIAYDFSDNEARLYFDEEIEGISILNYNFDNDEYSCMSDGEHYSLSESFEKNLRKNNFEDILLDNVNSFSECLNKQGVNFDTIKKITYKDIN